MPVTSLFRTIILSDTVKFVVSIVVTDPLTIKSPLTVKLSILPVDAQILFQTLVELPISYVFVVVGRILLATEVRSLKSAGINLLLELSHTSVCPLVGALLEISTSVKSSIESSCTCQSPFASLNFIFSFVRSIHRSPVLILYVLDGSLSP